MEAGGYLTERRHGQALEWMQELVSAGLTDVFHNHKAVAERLPGLRDAVASGQMTPFAASRELLALFQCPRS
jgi:LAO/AO transport system kinase